VEWKPEWSLAIAPIAAAIFVSIVFGVFTSAATAQWAAIITFFVMVPFVVGRLIDRAR
jgi:hypothetical protein